MEDMILRAPEKFWKKKTMDNRDDLLSTVILDRIGFFTERWFQIFVEINHKIKALLTCGQDFYRQKCNTIERQSLRFPSGHIYQ